MIFFMIILHVSSFLKMLPNPFYPLNGPRIKGGNGESCIIGENVKIPVCDWHFYFKFVTMLELHEFFF